MKAFLTGFLFGLGLTLILLGVSCATLFEQGYDLQRTAMIAIVTGSVVLGVVHWIKEES